jgi:hypothetical protein
MKEKVLQGMTDGLTEICRCWNGIECGKRSGDQNLKATIPSIGYDRPKQPVNVEYYSYFGSMISWY